MVITINSVYIYWSSCSWGQPEVFIRLRLYFSTRCDFGNGVTPTPPSGWFWHHKLFYNYVWFNDSPCAHFHTRWFLFATLKVGSACSSLCLLRDCLKLCQVCVHWLASWQCQSYFSDRVVTYVSKHQCVQLLWRQCLQKCRCLMTSLWTVSQLWRLANCVFCSCVHSFKGPGERD